MKKAADVITGIRILASAALLFFPAMSPVFFALYALAGLTDMIDGTVARKTGAVSEFGAKFDTAADFIFFAVCLIKLIPVIEMPVWLYVWAGFIALIKVVNIISGFILRKKLVILHTVMNKVSGVLLFILPYTLPFIALKFTGMIVCAAATFAAVQEGHFIRTGREE